MAHTPGPWSVSGVRVKLGAVDCQAVGPDGFSIAFVPIGHTHEQFAGAMADAKLIAGAPALLEALKRIADGLTKNERDLYGITRAAAVEIASAAIAKAEGKS